MPCSLRSFAGKLRFPVPSNVHKAALRSRGRCLQDSKTLGRVAGLHTSVTYQSWWRPDTNSMQAIANGSEVAASKGEDAVQNSDQQQHQDGEDSMRDGFGRRLSDMDRQYAPQTGIERRIHILGTGSIGKLVAHALRGLPNPPPVTLVFHRYKLLDAWEKGQKKITIEDDGHAVARGGLDVELMPEIRRQHGVDLNKNNPTVYDVAGKYSQPHQVAQDMVEEPSQQTPGPAGEQPEYHRGGHAIKSEPIHNLILATKAAYTIPALKALRPRLSSSSTICFLQNGMGIIDDVNTQLFPDVASRPNYMQGVITHGVNVPPQKAVQDPFFAVHAGHGSISIGLLPREGNTRSNSTDEVETTTNSDRDSIRTDKWAPSSRYLLRTLTRSPVLCAVGFTPAELLQLQLEKLAVNSVINPLTALLDNRNGSLLYNFALTRTMRLLLAETSQVIRLLPELAHVPNIAVRFSPDRLETLVVAVAEKTKNNISSMLADVRGARKTEIEYINGYIVRRGEELGIKCVVNYAIMQTVIGKTQMTTREARAEVPADIDERKKLNAD